MIARTTQTPSFRTPTPKGYGGGGKVGRACSIAVVGGCSAGHAASGHLDTRCDMGRNGSECRSPMISIDFAADTHCHFGSTRPGGDKSIDWHSATGDLLDGDCCWFGVPIAIPRLTQVEPSGQQVDQPVGR